MSFIDKNWKKMLNEKFKKKSGDEIWKKIRKDILDKFPDTQFQPEEKNIFNVFEMLRSEIKVVILGQDPYPEPGKATGRAFAVPPEPEYKVVKRESLNVIKEEIKEEKKLPNRLNLDGEWQTLEHWIERGVFLLNTALTVEKKDKNKAKSKNKEVPHLKFWEDFTNKVIEYISENSKKYPCIWMLWGVKAKRFKGKISNGIPVDSRNIDKILKEIREKRPIKDKNYILEAPHPSPKNGKKFYKSGRYNFLYANEILKALLDEKEIIKW